MGTKVNVVITEKANYTTMERLVIGSWWWMVWETDSWSNKHGFARSEEKAKKKAEKAAKTLVPEPEQRYTLEVKK